WTAAARVLGHGHRPESLAGGPRRPSGAVGRCGGAAEGAVVTPRRPPRLATRLLRRALPPADRDAVCGDLLEESRGRTARFAAGWYCREALAIAIRCGVRRRREGGASETRTMTTGPFDRLAEDVRYTLRSLSHARLFTVVVVLTLALGIGASTAIFSIVDGILLRPLPFHDPDRLVWINDAARHGNVSSLSWPDFLDWRGRVRSFDALAASKSVALTLSGAGDATRIDGRRVTANFFTALGVRPALGRGFLESDDRPGAEGVAIVADGFRRRVLAS